MPALRPACAVAVLAACLLAAPATPAPATPPSPADRLAVRYDLPVAGRVVRGFDPPGAPWDRAHRGVDLAVQEGGAVRTAAPGRVTFAGDVVGVAWVSVTHPDGVVTTYGPLRDVAVAAGEWVGPGGVVGTAAGGHHPLITVVHWSARRDGAYIDPLDLVEGWRPALLGTGGQEVTDFPTVASYRPWRGRAGGVAGWLGLPDGSPRATGPGWELPPNPNHVIGVAGFNSTTGKLPIDLTHLGYPPQQITYLSYAGRRPGAAEDEPHRDQLLYGPPDTWAGVDAAARRLEAQLRAHHAAHPGEAVDLVGHSQGGLVVLYYLLLLHDPADPGLPPVAHAMTIASPLEGTDAADALHAATRRPDREAVLRWVARRYGVAVPPRDAQVVDDLRVASDVADAVARSWEAAQADVWSSPLATGTRVLTTGASLDVVVPEHRTELPGSDHVVLPGSHSGARDTEAARMVARAFLADQPVPGAAGGLAHVASYGVGWAERVVGELLAAPVPPWWDR